jgi:hypothetical protein
MDRTKATKYRKARKISASWASNYSHCWKCPHGPSDICSTQVGNPSYLKLISSETNFSRFTEWARQYGGIFSVRNLYYKFLSDSDGLSIVEDGTRDSDCCFECHCSKRVDGQSKCRNLRSPRILHWIPNNGWIFLG